MQTFFMVVYDNLGIIKLHIYHLRVSRLFFRLNKKIIRGILRIVMSTDRKTAKLCMPCMPFHTSLFF